VEKFVDFASGKQGRSIRMIVGAVMVCVAVATLEGSAAWVVGVFGTILILSGALKLCALNLLVGRKITACPN